MTKEYKTQKKKTVATTVSQTLFKVLIAVAVIIFVYLIFDKIKFNTNGFDFSSTKEKNTETRAPEKLNWFDDFKGVENVPSRKQQEESGEKKGNFLGF